MKLKKIKKIVKTITKDKSWVSDSHTQAEYNGICYGLKKLVEKLEQLKENKLPVARIRWYKEDIISLGYQCTDNQAYEVLSLAEEQHDASVGINWEVLESWCEYVGLEKN